MRSVVGQPDVVLTYDDGPDPIGTDAVLNALDEHRATATFFVLVGRARRYPGLLHEVLAAGHEIGLHGIDHVRLTALPPTEVFRRTRDGRAALEDMTGTAVRWFRPPYGAQTVATWWAIRRTGLTSVVWETASHDWEHRSESELASLALGAGAGDVLLAHDGFAGPDDGVNHGAPPAIDRGLLARLMLNGFAERGVRCRSLGDCLTEGRPGYWAWFRN